MAKSAEAFRTISEVSELVGVPAHVLRFWESKFTQVKPVKRAGGRRYYRPSDIDLLAGIRYLLHDEGLAIRGVQKVLRDKGIRHVSGLSPVVDEAADNVDQEPQILSQTTSATPDMMALSTGDSQNSRPPTAAPDMPPQPTAALAGSDAPDEPPHEATPPPERDISDEMTEVAQDANSAPSFDEVFAQNALFDFSEEDDLDPSMNFDETSQDHDTGPQPVATPEDLDDLDAAFSDQPAPQPDTFPPVPADPPLAPVPSAPPQPVDEFAPINQEPEDSFVDPAGFEPLFIPAGNDDAALDDDTQETPPDWEPDLPHPGADTAQGDPVPTPPADRAPQPEPSFEPIEDEPESQIEALSAAEQSATRVLNLVAGLHQLDPAQLSSAEQKILGQSAHRLHQLKRTLMAPVRG
ncbi:MerR family transcriptional regulator [Thioclava sp. SK-1]|uniref:MerR family transcriptional regulator n=1 Tax=Thioclava sp. SK-1 TaxID=1889770 RepID=UPI0009F5E864|nr:MerR family transcriptional regulator [Thioclava sp. SK-1]